MDPIECLTRELEDRGFKQAQPVSLATSGSLVPATNARRAAVRTITARGTVCIAP